MRPTQFADDYEADAALDALERILPLRCPSDDFLQPLLDALPPHTSKCGEGCQCEGRGWLYPDPPDFWEIAAKWKQPPHYEQTFLPHPERWHYLCWAVWRQMRIVEYGTSTEVE